MDVARRHFTERGFKGTTLDAIAEEARCAKGALYLEFADKETLLRAVVEETFAAIRRSFAEEVMAIASPLQRLGETLRFAYRQYAREPLFGRLMREDPELRALGLGSREDDGRAARAQIEQLSGWVDEGVARGEIRPDVDRDVVPFALGVLRTAPQQLALTSGLVPVSQERVLEGLVQLFLAGLAAPPKPAASRAPAAKKKTTRKQPRRQS